jgi:D-glycero-D-manno-heptose 1,7-bisphosphate phosphatase
MLDGTVLGSRLPRGHHRKNSVLKCGRFAAVLACLPNPMSGQFQESKFLKRRAVFLDRDGVINRALERKGKPYPPTTLAEFEILPEVPAALKKLKAAHFLLVVATNQPDVGRGTLAQEVVEKIHAHMRVQLPVDRVEVCYHPGKGASDCDCRKPKPGMLLRAAKEWNIDLSQSWMVGDRWRDIDCGHAAGCRTIFIDRGYVETLKQKPDFSAGHLGEAADIILSHF